MKSTLIKDLRYVNGTLQVVPMECPDWYGIKGIGFTWVNLQSDPLLEYNGHIYNSHSVEDAMWDYFQEEKTPETSDDEFNGYMLEHTEDVFVLLNNLEENKGYVM